MKKQKITSAVTSQPSTHVPKSTSNFLSHEGSLSLALVASRPAGRKRKTTFLSGGKQSSFPRSYSSSSSKSVSLNHVVFMTGDSQHASHLDSNSNSFSGAKRPGGQTRSRNDTVVSKRPASSSTSLWSKVCSKNFRSK